MPVECAVQLIRQPHELVLATYPLDIERVAGSKRQFVRCSKMFNEATMTLLAAD